jgi:hypothetical protein
MKTKAILLTALAAALVLPVVPMLGTTVPRMNLEKLVSEVRKSNDGQIVQGRVEAIDVNIVREEGQRRPYTRVSIRVNDPIYSRKGDRRQMVYLRYLGGMMDSPQGPVDVSIAGMPKFQLGDNVILFLRENGDGVYHHVVGLSQGKYAVINETAVSSVSGVELVDPQTGKTMPSGFTESAPVNAFKAKIRELLK